MKLLVSLMLIVALQSGCQRNEMRIGHAEVSQCEAALERSTRTEVPRSDFLKSCTSAQWVALCKDGSASFSDNAKDVCKKGGGVVEWLRVIDG